MRLPPKLSSYAIDRLERRLQFSGPVVIGNPGQISTFTRDRYTNGDVAYYVQITPSGSGSELFRTDGTAAGTYVIRTGMPNSVGTLKGAGDYLYFMGARTDGYTSLFRMHHQTQVVSQLGSWLPTNMGFYDIVEWHDKPYALGITTAGAGVYSVDLNGILYRQTALNFLGASGAAPQLVPTDGSLISVLEDPTNPSWTQIWSIAETGGATHAATIQHRMSSEADVVGRVGNRAVMVLDGFLYSSDGTAAGTTLLHTLGSSYYIVETTDASFAAVYPFDQGLFTQNVGYTDGESFVTTAKPGYSAYNQTPAGGEGTLYFPSKDGAFRMTAGGQITLMDTAQVFNLGVIGSDAYFGTYSSVGRLREGYSQYITAFTNGNGYARPFGFTEVGSGFTSALRINVIVRRRVFGL